MLDTELMNGEDVGATRKLKDDSGDKKKKDDEHESVLKRS